MLYVYSMLYYIIYFTLSDLSHKTNPQVTGYETLSSMIIIVAVHLLHEKAVHAAKTCTG